MTDMATWRECDLPLRLIEIGEGWSIHADRYGDWHWVRDGDGVLMMAVDDIMDSLDALWDNHYTGVKEDTYWSDFLDWLNNLCHDDMLDNLVIYCTFCSRPAPSEGSGWAAGYGTVCEACLDDSFTICNRCDEWCRYPVWIHDDYRICELCRDNYYTFCDWCDCYYADDLAYEHEHDNRNCSCESPQRRFMIRNDSCEPLPQNRRVTVTLPAGVISEEGIEQISSYLRQFAYDQWQKDPDGPGETLRYHNWCSLSYRLEEIGPEWQAKQGNYTKRLSRCAYNNFRIKLPPAVISNVGNIAREHSATVDVMLAVTRDLNLSAEEFYHEDSCWWGSYAYSRCTLKSNGGFGMRTFDDDDTTYPSGRAWVFPMRACTARTSLEPTFETLTADAFIVFNGYGDLSGYRPARILAHMVGMTYRKINFNADEDEQMYVNGGSAYLVAPEDIAKHYTDGSFDWEWDQHNNLFDREQAAMQYNEREQAHV